jgi:hypothetical protein
MKQLLQQFAGMAAASGAGAALGGSQGGALSQFEELQKALQASNYQTDVATLTGGGALGVQSLDTAMKTTIQENEHFILFNQLQSTNATNIVDEYSRQTSVGGFLGGTTNTQMGVVRAAQGDYSREIGLVKFLMTLRQVGYVLNIGKNIVEATAVEERNGALQLLTDAEYLLFYGDSSASPTQYDGIFKQLDDSIAAGEMPAECVLNMNGAKLDSVEPFSKINVAVSRYGSWGRSTDVYLPNSVQNDLNMGLDPAFRWGPGQNTPQVGAHVEGIRLTNGVLKTHMDTFIHDEAHPMQSPFEVNFAAIAAANVAFKPVSIAGVAAAGTPANYFTAGRAGNYYYAVESIGASGEGMTALTKSAQVAVAAGNKVTLTITRSGAATETGYRIFRSKQDGVNTTSEFRLMATVKCAGATTVYVDENQNIPGTTAVPLLNMNRSADAIGWRQFQPMTKIPLPFGIGGMPVISWFQFLFGYLRITKPKHHGYIKNVLPSNALWRPHTGE